MTNTGIRVPVYERICTITGRPLKIQYAVNDVGTLYRRQWVTPVIRFLTEREGRWDKWERLEGCSLPAAAYKTDLFSVVRRGAQEAA